MALEVIGIEGQVTAGGAARGPATTTGIRNGTAYVAAAQPAGTDTTFQAGDIVVYLHSVENRRTSINAPATGNIHNASNHSVKIVINGGAESNMVDIGYVRGGNSSRQGSGAWAFTLPTGQTLQDIVVSHVISNQSGANGNYGRSHRLLVVRGAEADYGSNLALGTAVSNSSTASFPDQDPIEWEQPSSASWTSTNYDSGVGVIWFASYRRDSTGVDPTQDPGGTITRPTTTDFTGTSAGTGDGGFMTNVTQGRGHAAITYFQMGFLNYAAINGAWANGNTYGFVVADGDTNGGAGLGIFFREAATSTPGTPASLTADYAISVTGSPSTLGSEYAVTSTGTEADLQSSYTVKLTGNPETLTSSYAVKSTGTAQTLDSEYTVKLTGNLQTLSSSYAVTDQGQAQTLDSEYAVKDTSGTASLSGLYAVQSTGTPATLSSEYQVAVPDSEDLSSDYAVKVQGDAQSLTSSYAVKVQGQEQALSSDYSIKDTTGTANLAGLYAVKSTGTLANLSSEYEVSVPQSDNLGSSYAVKVQGDSASLASSYDISSATAGVAVDLDSQYSVKTTGSPQSIDGEYTVKEQGDAQALSGSYAVTDVGATTDLNGSYGVRNTGTAVDLDGSYAVTDTGNAQALSAGYAVTATPNGVSLGAEYTVSVTGDEQEVSSAYAVTSSDEQTLTGSYVISESDAIELASLYSVKISDTSEVSSSYAVTIPDTENLSASYTLIESKTQEIQASYEITGFTASAPVTELYAEYAVINQDHLGYKAFRQLSILRQRVK